MTYGNDCGYCGVHRCGCFDWESSTQLNERNLCPHRTAITPLLNNHHTERIRKLDIHLTVVDDFEGSADHIFRSALDDLKSCALSLPSLQTLSLSMHFNFDYFDPPFVHFSEDMFGWDTSPPAKLHHLILHGCCGGPILSLQNVTSFELTGESQLCSMDMSGTWYFSNFLFVIFHDFLRCFIPSHSFLSVSLLQEKTRRVLLIS